MMEQQTSPSTNNDSSLKDHEDPHMLSDGILIDNITSGNNDANGNLLSNIQERHENDSKTIYPTNTDDLFRMMEFDDDNNTDTDKNTLEPIHETKQNYDKDSYMLPSLNKLNNEQSLNPSTTSLPNYPELSTNIQTSATNKNNISTIYLNSDDSLANDFHQDEDEDGLVVTMTTTTITKFDSIDQEMTSSSDDKKRLRLEDFMRQIITQINTSSEKIWPNLLLDFTKNFSELNIPTYVLQLNTDNLSNIPDGNGSTNNALNSNRLVSNSDQDLLMDILNIAISSLSMPQTDRRVFACQLLLNIHDCLTMDTIESKVMPLLNDIVTNESTTSVRFTVCFVLANYAKRVEFEYFQTTIFPLFQKLSIIALDHRQQSPSSDKQPNQYSLCTSTTICFALLDSLTSLLSYLLHFNQIMMKKQQKKTVNNVDEEDETMINGEIDFENEPLSKDINEVFEFIHEDFLPLLKRTFQAMLDYIDQYRSMSIKIEQDLFNCFLHWRDQIGTHDSISQTLFSHYQSLILFVLILRDYLHNCDVDPVLCDLIDQDHWYLDYYYRLCAFHYVLPKSTDQNNLIHRNGSEFLKDSLLIDQSTNSILTKINLMDLGKNNTNNSTNGHLNANINDTFLNTNTISTNKTTTTTTSNFIGRYQVTSDNVPKTILSQTPSILQQHLQQANTDQSATNVTIQNNDFSIGSTQYSFSSNALNNLDIFGFFRYKTIACKITLVALVPAISDLYYITKNSNLLLAHQKRRNQQRINQSEKIKNSRLQSSDLLLVSNIETAEKTELSKEDNSDSNLVSKSPKNFSSTEDKEQIITRLIDILNTLSIDNNYEIAIKMSNIIEKLVERFTEPIRLYSLLTNVLQSQNFDVINQIIRNLFNVFSSMLASSKNNDETKRIIEYVIETFMRSESYLSTKPKWRLHIQYFDVMFRFTRIIPVDIVKRLIIPRLLLRFSTTRPIPCRQAVARCLLLVYLENFAQHDFEKFCLTGSTSQHQCCDHFTNSEWKLAYLSFDLFNWLDRNLKQSNKYQDRQIYIDIISILIRFLFRDSIEWGQQIPNHYLVDIQELCPCLMDTKHLLFRFSKQSRRNLKDLHSSQLFAMLLIQKYRLLHLFTEMSTKDRVNTIRASACTVLYSLLQCTNFWVVNNLYRLSENEPKPGEDFLEAIMDYYDSYMENSDDDNSSNGFSSEQLYRRLHSETDGIVLEELNKVFLLADDFRLDFNLNYYQLRNKRKKPRKEQKDFLEIVSTSIDSTVIELVDELLLFVENMNMDVLSDDDDDQIDVEDEGIDLMDPGVNETEPDFALNIESEQKVIKQSDNSRRGLIFISNSKFEKSSEGNSDQEKIDSLTEPESLSSNKSPKKRKSPKHNNNHHHNQHQKMITNNNKNLSQTKMSNSNKTITQSAVLTEVNTTVAPAVQTHSYRQSQQQKNNPNSTPKYKGSHSINNNNANKTGTSTAINHHMIQNGPLSRNKSHYSQRTIPLLPTPSPAALNHHHHSSKVPVYNNTNINNKLMSNPIVVPSSAAVPSTSASLENTATATYPGLCFRIVYPPPPPSPAQFYSGAATINTILTSQQQAQMNFTPTNSSCPVGSLAHPHSHHHHYHHGQPGFSTIHSKLPKTISTGISYRSIGPLTVSTTNLPQSTTKTKWTLHDNTSNHLYHRSLSIQPTSNSHLHQHQQQAKIKNKKIVKTSNPNSSASNIRQMSSNHHQNTNNNFSPSNNSNFMRIKKFKKKSENLLTMTNNLNSNNNNDSMETDETIISGNSGEQPDSKIISTSNLDDNNNSRN